MTTESHPAEASSSVPTATGTDPETETVPARYAREIQAREQAHNRCPVDVFIAGKNARYSWPYRLVNAQKARPSLAETCETLIIDSVINDPYYAVNDVLGTAHRLDADFVIGKDWPAFADPNGDGIHSLDSYEWTVSKYRDHECDAELIVPLQPPFDGQTVSFLRNTEVSTFALGGLRDQSGAEQVRHIRSFREIAGYDVNAHGLGVGTSIELISAIRKSVAEDPTVPPSRLVRHLNAGKRRRQQQNSEQTLGTVAYPTANRGGFDPGSRRIFRGNRADA